MLKPLSVLSIATMTFMLTGYHVVDVQAQAPDTSSHMTADTVSAAVNQYCIACHNKRAQTAGLVLEGMDYDNLSLDAETWEAVISKLRSQTMPPPGRPRPEQATYHDMASWMETELDTVAFIKPQAGRTETFHRLNRSEYQNSIRDLLDLDIDVEALLPGDLAYEHGFDNNGDVLSISPDLLARYLSAARKISRSAVGIPPNGPVVKTYRVHPDLLQNDRLSEELPFGSRGGFAVKHFFPVDGEYVVRVRLHRNFSDYIIGFGHKQQIDFRLDGKLLKRVPIGGASQEQMAPLSFSGNIEGHADWEFYMVNGDEGLEVRFSTSAGYHLVGISFDRKMLEVEGVSQPRQRGYGKFVTERHDDVAGVDSITVGGPYRIDGSGSTLSRQRVFVCQPQTQSEENACAQRILTKLTQRAFRRAVTDADLTEVLGFYEAGRQEGSFEQGIQFALERILTDPEFLFRIESDPKNLAPGEQYQLSDLELASRLSFFLWSSIPDEELLAIAIDGRLQQPEVLEQQVRRMLADPRTNALTYNFAAQWLRLRNLSGAERGSDDYPDFDENLRESFQKETELFVNSTIQEDRSVADLLGADYTFLNERLARHYGIPGIYGDRFRRVTFPKDAPRGGLLGQGSLLMVTSHPNRTSPVLRGKWLLEAVLGAPPPEPPPNVPDLPDRGEGGKPASVRERLQLHRKNPVCASCHNSIDPMGFALEQFDAIGTWRTVSETGSAIDTSAMMPSGEKFNGVEGLRALLLSRQDQFAQTVTQKLLAYALGRGLEYYDWPAVRKIAQGAAQDNYRWSSIILGIVKSTPFQMRQTQSKTLRTLTHGSEGL